MKRGRGSGLALIVAAFILVFAGAISVYAEEHLETDLIVESESDEEIGVLITEAETFDEEFDASAGLTPDSPLYFLEDKILSNFRSDSENREKKVAEMDAMARECKEGRQEACGAFDVSLEKYREHADEFEREVRPEEREDAERTSRAIRGKFVRDIAQNVDPGEKDELIREIMQKEEGIESAAEIADKIAELCGLLAKQDPDTYYRTCKTGEDAPKWQLELDEKLTDEQREEAKKFGEIMSQCFETAGQKCRCEDIPFTDFAETCSIVAPLATACEVEKDEEACEAMDNIEMPELPPYLQSIMDDLEGGISESRFDLHMPSECKEAGATNPKDCMKIMVQAHAPPECQSALANVDNEKKAREVCEKIMFDQNAPEECIEAGLRNHKECGKFMFAQSAPQECIDAGITGEGRNDPRKCEALMREFGGFEGRGDFEGEFQDGRGRGPSGGQGFGGANCRGIQDTQERLACYDGATQGARSFDERFKETKEQERQCANSCRSEGGAWDFSGGQCRCNFDNFKDDFRDRYQEHFREDFDRPQQQQGFRGPPECQGLSPGDCENVMRERFGQQGPPQGFEGGFGQGPPPGEGFSPPEGFIFNQPPEGISEGSFSSPESGGSSPESGSPSPEGGVSGGVITGWSVSSNNRFLWYYFN